MGIQCAANLYPDWSNLPKLLEIRWFRGVLFFISCCFRISLFPDPNGIGQRKSSDSTREDIPHGLCRFKLGVGGHMSVGVQREACRVVAEHGRHRFHVHAILERHGYESVPQMCVWTSTIDWRGQTRFCRAEMRPYCVKSLDNMTSISRDW